MDFKPTDEQATLFDAMKAGDPEIAVGAYAGSGKTATVVWTVKELKKINPNQRITLIYYNSAARYDAQQRLGGIDGVKVNTNHTAAFAAVGKWYAQSRRLLGAEGARNYRVADIASIFGAQDINIGGKTFSGETLTSLALSTVNRFTQTASWNLTGYHMPYRPQYDEYLPELRPLVVKLANEIWTDKCDQKRGVLSVTHDDYLKMWQLGKTAWYFRQDVLITDEEQDTAEVQRQIVLKHNRCQLVAIGDRYQRVYAYRDAEPLSDHFKDPTQLHFTRTFRFGGQIVDEANKWLAWMGAELPLVGHPTKTSRIVDHVPTPGIIIGRTNSAVVGSLIAEAAAGRKYAIGGGAASIVGIAEAIADLRAGLPTDHAELAGFETYDQFRDFAENDPSGENYKVLMRLVEEHGTEPLRDLAKNAIKKDQKTGQWLETPDVIGASAHSLKGTEAGEVRIVGTWQPTDRAGEATEPSDEDSCIAYVAVTRAIDTLDRGDLAYIDELSFNYPWELDDDSDEDEDTED